MASKVKVQDLIKSYGKAPAVRGVSFEIHEGEIFGLLGPNGAGKTTTLECVIGLREPDQGSVEICGFNIRNQPKKVKEIIGAQLQYTSLQDKITPREALKLYASFYENPTPTPDLIERFLLQEKADACYDTLSGGQKQRLALALALVNDPQFLLLDEPTANLDPQSRHELHNVIRHMRGDGRTVLLTTHYIEEAEQLCDRIAIIDHGNIIASGTPKELCARAQSLPRITVNTTRPMDLDRLKSLGGVREATQEKDSYQLRSAHVGETIIDLVKFIESEHNELLDLHIHKPSLEDVFLELTGRRLRD